jgi:hypothetical protein
MLDDSAAGSAVFIHKNNITVGNGRVLWAKAAAGTSGIPHPEGWVLPGGARTQDRDVAHAAAAALDELSRAKQA